MRNSSFLDPVDFLPCEGLGENLGANEQFRPAPTERRDIDVSREASALLTLIPSDAYLGGALPSMSVRNRTKAAFAMTTFQ